MSLKVKHQIGFKTSFIFFKQICNKKERKFNIRKFNCSRIKFFKWNYKYISHLWKNKFLFKPTVKLRAQNQAVKKT